MPRRKTPTARQKRFTKADVVERVQLAAPLAHEMVASGLRESDQGEYWEHTTIVSRVSTLIGNDGPKGIPDDEYDQFEESLEAAYALGIAVGQLLSPAMFTKGGAR